jgi:hypothetical protein
VYYTIILQYIIYYTIILPVDEIEHLRGIVIWRRTCRFAVLCVEKDSLSANKWDEIDGRKTDVKNTKPKKLSYAEIAKKRKLSWKRDESSKNTPQSE